MYRSYKILTAMIMSICLLFISLSANAAEQSLDRIVAIVNSQVITQNELDAAVTRAQVQISKSNQLIPPMAQLRHDMLQSLIFQKLQLQMGKKNGITATPAEVDAALKRVMKQNHFTLSMLKKKLASDGVSLGQFKVQMKQQLIISKVQQGAIASRVNITPAEVNAFMQKIAAHQQGAGQYHVIDILVPAASTSQFEAAQAQAKAISVKLEKGETLKNITTSYKNVQVNDLDWRSLANMPGLFADPVAKMKLYGISQPIKAPNGYHVLQLVGRHAGNAAAPSRAEARELLFRIKFEKALKKWLTKLRATSYVKVINQ